VRYRKLSPEGDYQFGRGLLDHYIDQPEAVGQSVLTRLNLWQGQWFADQSQGVPWMTQVLGERTQQTRDVVVREAVLDTPGVSGIAEYASLINPDQRSFAVGMILDTAYGKGALALTPLPGVVPPLKPPPGPPRSNEIELGIAPGKTGLYMKRADLGKPGDQAITQFFLTAVDAGRL
jgi:hypothetical protein